MKIISIVLVFLLLTIDLIAQFSENATHIFQTDTDKKLLLGTNTPGNSDQYKIFIDLRNHFTTINDDNQGIKIKTGGFAIEFDNSATSIDPNFDHPVIKPSGDRKGFLGKPLHRWFHFYAATIHGDAVVPNEHLMYEIGTASNQWKRIWSEAVRAKNYFPEFHNTGQIGGENLAYKEMYVTDVNCVTFMASSDARLKRNLRHVQQPLQKILALKAWKYDYQIPQTTTIKPNKLGFVAQELQEVLPDLVQKNEKTDLYAVDYIGLIPILVEGIKEQQQMIEAQQKEIKALKQMVEMLNK